MNGLVLIRHGELIFDAERSALSGLPLAAGAGTMIVPDGGGLRLRISPDEYRELTPETQQELIQQALVWKAEHPALFETAAESASAEIGTDQTEAVPTPPRRRRTLKD